MTPIEALLSVQQALRDHGLPGGAGLRESDRTFIVVLAPGDRKAAPAVAELLSAMGCEVSVNGFVYGHLADGLLPVPPLPPVLVSSADAARAAELATSSAVKRCSGPCGQVRSLEEFPWWRKASGHRGPYCGDCDRARQRGLYQARVAQR